MWEFTILNLGVKSWECSVPFGYKSEMKLLEWWNFLESRYEQYVVEIPNFSTIYLYAWPHLNGQWINADIWKKRYKDFISRVLDIFPLTNSTIILWAYFVLFFFWLQLKSYCCFLQSIWNSYRLIITSKSFLTKWIEKNNGPTKT